MNILHWHPPTLYMDPFRQDSIRPIDETAKNIDSFLFKDSDGKYYLYHVRFNKGNYLWVAEFDLAERLY